MLAIKWIIAGLLQLQQWWKQIAWHAVPVVPLPAYNAQHDSHAVCYNNNNRLPSAIRRIY